MWTRRKVRRWLTRAALAAPLLMGCSGDDASVQKPDACLGPLLPLQNPRAFTLGETFYLPRLSGRECPAGAAWQMTSAPAGSQNRLYMDGAPEPRFTPDQTGVYRFGVPSVSGSEIQLTVVARRPRERFRNHYLTALYGAARVGDEIWTANGATYTVTRVRRGAGSAWEKVDEIPVGSWPAAVAWRAPLRYALVAQRGADTVGFVDRERGVLEDALWVGDEPTGIAVHPDATRAYVSLPTMRQVAVVDVQARSVVARVEVGFDPRALVLSANGERLFVASYRSGNREKDLKGSYGPTDGQAVWVVDTRSLSVVDTLSSLSALHRAIALAEDGSELYVAASDGDPIPSQGDLTAKPFVHEAIALGIDERGVAHDGALRRADLTRQPGSGGPVVSPAGVLARADTLWLSSESSGLLLALDRASLQEKARVGVGAGARQLLALDDGSIAVHCTQSNELWLVDAAAQPLAAIGLVSEDGRSPAIALGEQVFTRPGGNFAVNHSCSSCHTEAANDGMVWRFGLNLYDNVRPLQLLSATTPVGWAAYVSNTQVFGYTGPSSIVSRPVSPEDADGLDQFLASLIGAPRATGRTRLDGSYTEAAERGKALFESKAQCATCHTPPLYTNRDVVPVGKSGVPADVPSLFGAYRHAAYFVKAGARRLESAVEIAADFVGVALTPAEKADLTAFLYELTPKGGAPLAIWPDIDSREGVEGTVTPWVEFADPVDDSRGVAASEVAAPFVKLEDGDGIAVAGRVEVEGWRVRFVPETPLAQGAMYTFRVLAGLPFQSGGELWAERRTRFQVAAAPAGTWPEVAKMEVQLSFPPGAPPVPVSLMVRTVAAPTASAPMQVVIEPMSLGAQQRQPVWVRVDGNEVFIAPLALPVTPTAVGNGGSLKGRVSAVENGVIRRIEGTLHLSGPGLDVPNVPFAIDATP